MPCPDLPDLAAQDAVDVQLLAFVEGRRAPDLAREVHIHRGVRVQVERMDDTLSHLFQHQTHHRGQAHAMLSGTAVARPQLDEFLMADDAAVRAADLDALGWTERDLMEAG